MNNQDTKKVNFCLTTTTRSQVEELAKIWDRSISSTLRFLITKAYKQELQGGEI